MYTHWYTFMFGESLLWEKAVLTTESEIKSEYKWNNHTFGDMFGKLRRKIMPNASFRCFCFFFHTFIPFPFLSSEFGYVNNHRTRGEHKKSTESHVYSNWLSYEWWTGESHRKKRQQHYKILLTILLCTHCTHTNTLLQNTFMCRMTTLDYTEKNSQHIQYCELCAWRSTHMTRKHRRNHDLTAINNNTINGCKKTPANSNNNNNDVVENDED